MSAPIMTLSPGLDIGVEFQQFFRKNKHIRLPGKLSEVHSNILLFFNPGDKVLKCVKSRGQICPVL